jgi:hypothetical protein
MHLLDPRYTAAIPTTARAAVPFTPKSLDPAKLRREQEAALDRDSEAIDKDEHDFEMGFSQSQQESGAVDRHRAELKARREKNAEHRTNLEKAHRELALRVVSSPTFMLKIPTPLDRDQLNVRLIEMGAQAIGQEQLRATMIEACFHYDWSDGEPDWDANKNENAANENATFLDTLWQIEEAHNKAMAEWQEQEAERILDAWNGAPERERATEPRRLISVRDSARQILLMDKMMQTPMMRRITAKQVDYERRHRMILVRLSLAAVSGIPNYTQPYIGDGSWEVAEVEALRQAMDDAYGTLLGDAAWEELIDRIARGYVLDGFEEKNSDSPLGNTIDLSSSVEPSGESANNDGTSTASSSSPIPSDASETITEKPSDTGSASEMPTAAPSAGQTGEGSLTSQSN